MAAVRYLSKQPNSEGARGGEPTRGWLIVGVLALVGLVTGMGSTCLLACESSPSTLELQDAEPLAIGIVTSLETAGWWLPSPRDLNDKKSYGFLGDDIVPGMIIHGEIPDDGFGKKIEKSAYPSVP